MTDSALLREVAQNQRDMRKELTDHVTTSNEHDLGVAGNIEIRPGPGQISLAVINLVKSVKGNLSIWPCLDGRWCSRACDS